MKTYGRFAAAVLIAALVAVPMFAARGSANFTTFVALGDSYGAGFESGSLNQRHQVWSWPAIIARQVGLQLCPSTATAADACWAQPLVSFPGIANELVLNSLVPSPAIAPAPGQGQPLMTTFGRPYNNLSVPGGTIGVLLTVKGNEPQQNPEPTPVSFGRFILRGLGTPVEQAIAQHPTFIAVWAGGNDYLNVLFSGTTATVTSVDDFKARYELVLDSLIAGAPNAGMVVGNLPNGIPPYLKLVPNFLVDPSTGLPITIGGQRVYWVVDNGGGNIAPVAPDTLIPFQTRDKLALGYGLPPQFKAIPPFNLLPHVGEPLSPNDVITAEELATVFTRIASFNTIITQAAAARNIPVADVAGLFNRVTAPAGMRLGPITVSGAAVTGGFFSNDFFHLTDLGYLLMGNEFIKAINSGYDTDIPLASITQLFANNGADFGEGGPGPLTPLTFHAPNSGITDAAIQQIMRMWAEPAAKSSRRRAVSH